MTELDDMAAADQGTPYADGPAPDDLVTMEQAAELVATTETAIYFRIRRGSLPAWLVGGKLYVSRADLAAYVDRRGRPRRYEPPRAPRP